MEPLKRPVFRRQNQHLFERAYFTLSSTQRTSIPLPLPFGLPTSDSNPSPDLYPREEGDAREETQEDDPMSWLPAIPMMQLRALSVSLALTLPIRPKKAPAKQENPVPESTELSVIQSVVVQRLHDRRGEAHSFLESGVCVEHIEDAEDYFNLYDNGARRPFVTDRPSRAHCSRTPQQDLTRQDSGYASLLGASSSSATVDDLDFTKRSNMVIS